MIKNILYVEDGSVDLDELNSTLTAETKVIIYRQGCPAPILIQPTPINDIFSEAEFKAQKELKEFQEETEELICKLLKEKCLTKRAQKLIDRFGTDHFWG